jgi:hypothetical protein
MYLSSTHVEMPLGFKSSVTWHNVDGQAVSVDHKNPPNDLLLELAALKMEASQTFETSWTTHPKMQRNIAEGFSPQPQGCNNFK